MADVGINLTMTENVSAISPKVSESLRSVGQAGQDMRDALELGDLENKYKAFAERVDKIHDLQREAARDLTQQPGAPGQRPVREAPAGIQQVAGQAPGVMTGGAGAVAAAGRGDVLAGGAGGLGALQGIIGALGPVGMILGAAAGALFAINTVSKVYEEMIPTLLDVSGSLGEFGDSVAENTNALRKTMGEISDIAGEFGYTFQVGAEVMKTMATRGGLGREQALTGMEDVMAYGRGYGVAPGQLAGAQALAGRFGQGRGLMAMTAGGLEQAQMGPGLFKEFLDSTMSIFEEGLGRGIVKGFEDINTTQTWIAQLGDAFKGQYGLNLYRKMESAVVGATALSGEQDIIMYRAAQRLLGDMSLSERQSAGLNTNTYIDVMKLMEQGMTPQYFEHIKGIIAEMTGAEQEDTIELFRQAFGVNYVTAQNLTTMNAGEASRFLKAPEAKSKELEMLSTQQDIAESVREISTTAADIKASMEGGTQKVLDQLSGGVEKLAERRVNREDVQEFKTSEVVIEAKENVRQMALEGKFGSKFAGSVLFRQMTKAAGGKFGVGPQVAGQQIADIFAGLTEEQIQGLGGGDVLRTLKGAAYENILETEKAFGPAGPIETPGFKPGDLPAVLEALLTAINDWNATRAKEQQITVNIPEGE